VNDDREYLRYILDCIEWIERFLAAGGREDFLDSRLIRDAVLRNLHTLTEASLRLSDPLKNAHPEIEWKPIARFRNMVVHNLFGLDLEIVWAVVEHRLPVLKGQIARILHELSR